MQKNYLVHTKYIFSVCLFAGSVDLRLCGCKTRYNTTEYYVIQIIIKYSIG